MGLSMKHLAEEDQVSPIVWEQIDLYLFRHEYMPAINLYRTTAHCGFAEAKYAIGIRLREHSPLLWSQYQANLAAIEHLAS